MLYIPKAYKHNEYYSKKVNVENMLCLHPDNMAHIGNIGRPIIIR
jgi:hypothetical protein